MVLLNMMIGTMDVLIGFLVLLAIIIIETVFLSKTLTDKWIKSKIFYTVLFSNLLSTLVDFLGLLSWLWDSIVSQIKIIFSLPQDFTSNYFVLGFFIIAFILTLLLEIPFNLLFLKSDFAIRSIIIGTINANLITYVFLACLAATII